MRYGESWHPEGGPWGGPRPFSARQRLKHLLATFAALGSSPCDPSKGIVILAYHGTVRDRSHVWWVDFVGHMATLEALGWRVVGLGEVIDRLASGALPTAPTAAITFDDGWATNLDVAFPELERRGWPATVFVPTGLAGRSPFLGIDDIRRLRSRGIEVGNHTHSHPDLERESDARIAAEIEEGSQRLAEWTGKRPEFFCYPFGRWSPAARDAVARAGFRGACSSRFGRNLPGDDPFLLRRLIVEDRETRRRFRVRLAGGYERLDRFRPSLSTRGSL